MSSSILPQPDELFRSSTGISEATFDQVEADKEEERAWFRCWQQLFEIKRLSEDWDGAGAEPIDPSITDSAADVLRRFKQEIQYPAPSRIVPTPSGSVCIEWETETYYLEAEILEPYVLEMMLEYEDGPTYHRTQRIKPSRRTEVIEDPTGPDVDINHADTPFD